MTDKDLQQLAKAYAAEYSYHKDVANDTEEFLRWLTKTHCIVSREKVRALEDNIHGNIMYAHDEEDWQEAAHYILDVMPRRFIAIFGKSTFETHNPTEQ